jgi:hypothetical protein
MVNQPVHLVVRFSDTMFDVGDVIARHNEVVAQHGAVWFGKMGSTLAIGRIDLLNKQIQDGVPTFLYLVKGNRRIPTPYRAPLLLVSKTLPPKEKPLVPQYYAEKKLVRHMNAWMKVKKITPIELDELDALQAVSSVLPLSKTLARSSSGYFLVQAAQAFS